MNYRLVATQVGELLKWGTSRNEINRTAVAVFRFQCERFPTEGITSQRAQLIYCWLMSLARQSMEAEQRERLLVTFCQNIAPDDEVGNVLRVLSDNGVSPGAVYAEGYKEFYAREFHSEVVRHSRKYFLERNYFHAVFESCKAYNRAIQRKSQSTEDGQSLMLAVWGFRGVLKITRCESETDENVQEGIKFMSAGLMRTARNPPAHEPALDWPVKKDDCLDILSLLSFLFRQLEKAVYVPKA